MQNKNKILIVGDIRPITDAWLREEISYSRMVEMLNELVDKKAILREELEGSIHSLEWNVNYELSKLYVDQNYEASKTNVLALFLKYKQEVFKKIKENLNKKSND